MRNRSLIAVSTTIAATLLLAGCAGTEGATGQDSDTDSKTVDLCSSTVEPGAASDEVTADGEFGTASEAKFELGQTVEEAQRSVLSAGDGAEISEGDYVSYALSAFDGETGDRIGDAGYADGELLPAPLTAEAPLGQLIGCASVGSRLSIVFPTTEQAAAQFYILDVLDVVPTAAWGDEKEPAEGAPAVTLEEDGAPSVEIPEGDAPAELQISVLKEGDGAAVAAGDTSLLQYHGVSWESGETFDSSWANGEPIQIQGNTYVEGFVKALEGQKAGSQVLVVIPPALAYGEEGTSEHELAGQTLVFVIDILATMHPAAA